MHLDLLLKDVRACRFCEVHLPLGPRPLVQASTRSRIVIIGQAPGKAAHESGKPWADRSGDRLRDWLGVDDETFYDETQVAIVPMGFCYPGTGERGDLPPRPECAATWHERLRRALGGVELVVLAGRYAIEHELGGRYGTLTEAVAAWPHLLPSKIALPHPSPRNNRWLARHDWFERETVPALRERVTAVLTRRRPPD